MIYNPLTMPHNQNMFWLWLAAQAVVNYPLAFPPTLYRPTRGE